MRLRPLLPALIMAAFGLSASTLPDNDEALWSRALGPRAFQFPEDHGSHPDFATEWWYLTGHVTTEKDEDLGFQATWFRRALIPEVPAGRSSLAVRDVILFHGGFTDVENDRFYSASSTSRAAGGWAGHGVGELDVWLLDQRLYADDDRSWRAEFRIEGRDFDLHLEPTLEPLLHGDIPGLSQKGPEPGEASYYASNTRVKITGQLQREPGGAFEEVTGQAWFDHEFFTQQLAEQQIGWDWFSVALDDGTDLMLFHIRNDDGTLSPTSAGTLRRDGERSHLSRDDFEIEVLDTWQAPGIREDNVVIYPSRWRLRVPSRDLLLEVEPLVMDQEHRGDGPGAMAYWEGLCRFVGQVEGRRAQGMGFVELVGYRGSGPNGL